MRNLLKIFGTRDRDFLQKCKEITHNMNNILVKDMRNKIDKDENESYNLGELKFTFGAPMTDDSLIGGEEYSSWVLLQFIKCPYLQENKWETVKIFSGNYSKNAIRKELINIKNYLELVKNSKRYK